MGPVQLPDRRLWQGVNWHQPLLPVNSDGMRGDGFRLPQGSFGLDIGINI